MSRFVPRRSSTNPLWRTDRTRPGLGPVSAPPHLPGSTAIAIGPELPSESTVNQVLDLTMRIGEILMASGAGAADVTATAIAVTSAFGLPHCEVDVIFSSISVCCQRGVELPPVTAHRVVRSRALDYTRLAAVENLVRRITAGDLDIDAAHTSLTEISEAPHPYPRWVATLAWAALAASVTILLGGGPMVALAAGLISAIIDRVGRLLNRRALPFFFQQAVGGLLATALSLIMLRLGILPPGIEPALVVAAAITVLLSGLSFVGSVQDAISGYNVTAAGRTMEVTMMSAGLIAGVVFALGMGAQLGLPRIEVAEPLSPTALHLPVQILAGAATAAAFALASYAAPRALLVAGAAGALGAGGYRALILVQANPIAASGVAAVLIGLCAGTVSRQLRLPPLVVAVSGLTPLLPGLTIYRSMYELAVTRRPDGFPLLMQAVAIALALAAGVVLGEYLAQPVRSHLGRLERRLAGPRMVGPLRPTRRRLQ
jgi:uncharacterized membrane protein YjjP (DUF1212 family)